MKSIKNLFIISIILFTISCSSTKNFPVSRITPAAEIKASVKKDKNNNYAIKVSTKYMASADRLSPAKKTYVVWIVTTKNGTMNIGQLAGKNGKTSHLSTSTAYEVEKIFITAEDKGDISYPHGDEISSVKF